MTHKKLIVATISVLIVAIVVTGGFMLFPQIKQQGKVAQSTPATPAPAGWKNFASKRLGVRFQTPQSWTVTETDIDAQYYKTGGCAYKITIKPVETKSSETTIAIPISGNTVDELITTLKNATTGDSFGTAIRTESTKWHTYDATRVYLSGTDTAGKKVSSALLYVKIGACTYRLPEYAYSPFALDTQKPTDNDWKTFVESLDINI